MMKHILITILLCLGVLFSPAMAQDSFLLERAKGGDAEAQFELGVMYYYGDGVPEDEEEAAKWTRLAAEQGHAGAQNNLGLMYDNGNGVRQNDEEAVYWYRQAAGQGLAQAQHNLGLMYFYGEGVRQDREKAVYWYCKAAEQGYKDTNITRLLMGWLGGCE